MTPVEQIIWLLLVTLHLSDPFTDDIALAHVTFYCTKNAFQGSNKVIHMFIQTDSQGVKIAPLADDEVFVRR